MAAGIENAGLTIVTITSGPYLEPFPTVSSWLPLTTPFTYPSSCTDQWIQADFDDPGSVSNSVPSSCQPDSTSLHSPGTCIEGYYIARVVEYRKEGYTSGGERVWGANCCRNDMTSYGPFASCTSSFSTPITKYQYGYDAVTMTRDDGSPYTFTTIDTEAVDNTTIITSGQMLMQPFLVYWQSSDLSDFDPEYASALAENLQIDFTPTGTEIVTAATASPPDRSGIDSATPTSPPELITTDSGSGSGLSTGAKAGIGVGVAVGAILLGVTAFLLYREQSRKKAKLDRNSAIQNEQPEFVQTEAP